MGGVYLTYVAKGTMTVTDNDNEWAMTEPFSAI